jgi:hypothetical protein
MATKVNCGTGGPLRAFSFFPLFLVVIAAVAGDIMGTFWVCSLLSTRPDHGEAGVAERAWRLGKKDTDCKHTLPSRMATRGASALAAWPRSSTRRVDRGTCQASMLNSHGYYYCYGATVVGKIPWT